MTRDKYGGALLGLAAADALIGVSALAKAEWLIEIEAVAVLE